MFKIPLFGLSSVFYTSCTKKEPYLFIGKTHKFKNCLNLMTLDWFVDSYSDSIGTLECKTSIDLTEKEYKKFIHNIYPTLKNGMKTMMI